MKLLVNSDAKYIPLKDGSVHCVVTSPPYFGLRDYGTAEWVGGDSMCDHVADPSATKKFGNPEFNVNCPSRENTKLKGYYYKKICGKCGAIRADRQIGLEETVEDYVQKMVIVGREIWRVLRDDGTFWLNLGDSYAGGGGASGHTSETTNCGRETSSYGAIATGGKTYGLKPKDLIGIPWRVAFALQGFALISIDDIAQLCKAIDGRNFPALDAFRAGFKLWEELSGMGWYWNRQDIIWHKTNPMPESVKDRCTKAHEYIFLLTKNARYWYDHEAIKEGGVTGDWDAMPSIDGVKHVLAGTNPTYSGNQPSNNGKRNKRSVWTVTTKPYPGSHYACVDTRTEALTPEGWKKQTELNNGDRIAIYNPDTDLWDWGVANFYRYQFNGDMISIEKKEASQFLTPEHKCIIRRKMGHQGRDGWGVDTKQAKDLMPNHELLLSARYTGTLSDSIGIHIAALLGWFVTDGGIRNTETIRIYQSISANKEKCEKIRKILNLCNAEYTEFITKKKWNGRPANMLTFNIVGDVAKKIIELAPNKMLQMKTVCALSNDESKSLFKAIIDGDGCRRSDGRIQIIQKNKTHIDAFQALAVMLGYKTILTKRKDTNCYQLYVTTKKWLTLRSANGVHNPIPRQKYNGVVWCPSVKTGFWIARRNGKVFITGNTFPPDLIEPCILAGCPEKVCPKCGAPWERIVKKKKVKMSDSKRYSGVSMRNDAEDGRSRTVVETVGWQPTCDCGHDETVPATVLDPFVGSGTTCMVARKHRRKAIGLDLSFEYLNVNARERLQYGGFVHDGAGNKQLTLEV